MFKFMILFKQPDDPTAFENAYNDLLALMERMPDIQRRQVIHVVGSPTGPAAYFRILEVYFRDQAQMQVAMRSAQGQEAGAELQKRFAPGSFELLFAEVYEEAGGSTPRRTQ